VSSLFEQTLPTPTTSMFAGAEYEAARDGERLLTQVERIRDLAIDGKWRTLQRLCDELRKKYPRANFPEPSVSAQLRNLKKIGYRLNKHNVLKRGYLAEYQLLAPEVR
jgi:hypothetical protein